VTPQIADEQTTAEAPPGLPGWLTAFEPRRGLSNGHLQTIVGNFLPRPPLEFAAVEELIQVDPADGSRVLCHCHWQPEEVRAARLTVVLVHGLEGSSNSRYIQGLAARACSAGFNVVRMNMRNCGGTDTWTPSLYHSALSSDVDAVLRHFAQKYALQRLSMVGYSMGGNLVLKLAGELASDAPEWLLAAVAVSPAADLAPSADALHEPQNRLYEWHFLRNLMRRFRRKASLYPQRYGGVAIGPVHSIRDFDQEITARFSGFQGAEDYYARASAARLVHRIAIPTLVLHADDDPFIRLTPPTAAVMQDNPAIILVGTSHGGHCAFLAAGPDRHWAEATLLRYLMETVGHAHGS
jgi:hypothetical protein